jgi:DNA-binding Lrp family transcriptional regulator
MKTTFFYLKAMFAACLTLAIFAACSDDDDKSSLSSKIELSSNESEAVLAKPAEDATAITFDIKFTATGEWKAKTSHGWLSLDKKRGTAGEHTILVTVKENKEVVNREAKITIVGSNNAEPVVVTVVQHGIDAELVFNTPDGDGNDDNSMELKINNEAGSIAGTVEVVSNYDWTVEIAEEWLSYEITEAGDNGVSKNISFYADPKKLSSFSEEASVSFTYKSATKATPVVVSYKVKVNIVPTVTFTVNDEEISEFSLERDIDDNFKKIVTVTSNFKGIFSDLPEWLVIENITGESITDQEGIAPFGEADFFTSEQTLIFSLKDEYLDTEKYEPASLKITGSKTGEIEFTPLTVKFNGAGNDYISVNAEGFGQQNTENGYYTFEAEGETSYDFGPGVCKSFSVKAGSTIKWYLAKMENDRPTNININWEDENSDEWWAMVQPKPSTRSKIESQEYNLILKNRNTTDEWIPNAVSKKRYMALFVVPNTVETFADLFNEDGELLPEYEDKFIKVEQKGLKKNYEFVVKGLSLGGTIYELQDGKIIVPATGGEFQVVLEANNIDAETDGLGFYYRITGEPNQEGWDGIASYDPNAPDSFVTATIKGNEDGSVSSTLTITENESQSSRTESSCGFVADTGHELLCKFTIIQKGKE